MDQQTPLAVSTITSLDDFERLRSEWDDLARRVAGGTPFLSPDWFRCCLDTRPHCHPVILAVRDSSELCGIAPLWRIRGNTRGITTRAITFISSPETPEADFLVDPDHAGEIFEAIVGHLTHRLGGTWDVLCLGQWPTDSPNIEIFERLIAARGLRRVRGLASITPYLPITGNWDDYLRGKSYLFRKSRRGIVNRVQRVADVSIERIRRGVDASTLEVLLHISERTWKHEARHSLAARNELRRFFASLLPAAARQGWLDLWILRIAGAPVAFEFDLQHGGVIHALRAEFDDAFSKLSPGSYLEYCIVKSGFEDGCKAYYCGPGLDAYKLRWTERTRGNAMIQVYGRTPRGLVLGALEGSIVPLLRRLAGRNGPPKHPLSAPKDGESKEASA